MPAVDASLYPWLFFYTNRERMIPMKKRRLFALLLTLMMPAVFIAGFFLKIGAGTILAACALTALLRIAGRAGRAAV